MLVVPQRVPEIRRRRGRAAAASQVDAGSAQGVREASGRNERGTEARGQGTGETRRRILQSRVDRHGAHLRDDTRVGQRADLLLALRASALVASAE